MIKTSDQQLYSCKTRRTPILRRQWGAMNVIYNLVAIKGRLSLRMGHYFNSPNDQWQYSCIWSIKIAIPILAVIIALMFNTYERHVVSTSTEMITISMVY